MTQHLLSVARPRAAVALLSALVLAGTAACFSDRSTDSVTPSNVSCDIPSTAAGASIVFINAFTFQPAQVRVKAGGKVAWVNCETNVAHTSTSDAAGWDSGNLPAKALFTRTFPTAGTFPYHCAFHPGMKATVVVDP